MRSFRGQEAAINRGSNSQQHGKPWNAKGDLHESRPSLSLSADAIELPLNVQIYFSNKLNLHRSSHFDCILDVIVYDAVTQMISHLCYKEIGTYLLCQTFCVWFGCRN